MYIHNPTTLLNLLQFFIVPWYLPVFLFIKDLNNYTFKYINKFILLSNKMYQKNVPFFDMDFSKYLMRFELRKRNKFK